MGTQNKIALGVAALGGALAVGNDATAQTIVSGPLNVGRAYGVGTVINPQIDIVISPNFQFYLSVSASAYGSAFFAKFNQYGTVPVSTVSHLGPTAKGLAINSNPAVAWASNRARWVTVLGDPNPLFSTERLSFNSSIYTAFRAVSANAPGGYDYGWIKVDVVYNYAAQSISVVPESYGYGTLGAPINVGQTSAAAVPEPASAAMLAFGAMALGARGVRRMKRTVLAAKKAA